MTEGGSTRGWRLERGIWVPGEPIRDTRTAPPAEATYVRAYITYSELIGTVPTWEDLFSRLRDTGLHSVMNSLSFINSVLFEKGTLVAQTELVSNTFDSDLKNRILRLPDWRGRVVYSPVQTTMVMKAAILHSPNHSDTRGDAEFGRAMMEILLIANDLRDADSEAVLQADTPIDNLDELARVFLSHAVRATLADGAESAPTAIARSSIIFTRLARDERVQARAAHDAIDLDSAFEGRTGVPLDIWFALGLAFVRWFQLGAREPLNYPDRRGLNPDTFFSQSRLDPEHAAAILRELLLDYDSAQAEFRARDGGGRLFAYDSVPFLQHPLFRILPTLAVPVNLAFMVAKFSTSVYWTVFDSLSERDRRRLSGFYGHIVEAYVREILLRALPTATGTAQRVFPEFVYRVGRREYRTSDVVVVYPDAAIFIEVTATRLRMDATRLADDAAAVEEDFERIIIGKARQLHDRIEDFRSGAYTFDGMGPQQVRTILPVIVTGEHVPMWTATARIINAALGREGLLERAGVQPLRIIDVDELELLETLIEQGADLLTVLGAHSADGELRNVSLKNFLRRRYSIAPNRFLLQEYERLAARATDLLFGAPST